MRESIRDIVSNAFKMLSNAELAESVTYNSITTGAYDPDTNQLQTSVSVYTVPAVLARFKMNELDKAIVVQTDMKCLIAAKDLPAIPTENDQIVAKGKTWNVQRIMGVPGDSLHILHIREV